MRYIIRRWWKSPPTFLKKKWKKFMKLNKRQVKAVLDILKKNLKKNYPYSKYSKLHLQGQEMYVTDGYQAYVFQVENPNQKENGTLDYFELEKWYKLADRKEQLDLNSLQFTSNEEQGEHYILGLFNIKRSEISGISLNPDYLKTASLILDSKFIRLHFQEKTKPILITGQTEKIKGLVMPVKGIEDL